MKGFYCRMNKRFFLILLVIIFGIVSLTSYAEEITLILPSMLNRIDEEAFCDNTSITSVVIPDTVDYIGPRAFAGCTGLRSVFVPGSVTYIGEDAIPNNDQIIIWGEMGSEAQFYAEEHNIPFNTTTFVTDDGICLSIRGNEWAVTYYNGNGINVVIPSSIYGMPVTSIENYAFTCCNTLLSVLIPYTVDCIEDNAFVNNNSLWTIYGASGSCSEALARSLSIRFIDPYVKIYTMPTDVDTLINENAVFYIEADNVNQYIWQVRQCNDDEWENISEGIGSDGSLSVPYDEANTEKQYRCMLVGTMGDILFTDIVGITYYPCAPERLDLSAPTYLAVDSTLSIQWLVYPEEACQKLSWSSSNPSAVTIDETGLITAVDEGRAIITAITINGIAKSITIYTTNISGTTIEPERITPLEELDNNMARIEAIRISTHNAIDSLVRTGEITASEASERKAIINRAFEMQAFPWMTLAKQEYWSTDNAHKRFLPGNVYYGMPYIQHGWNNNYANREYNVDKALSENRYYYSDEGYYILNQNRLLNGFYVGNDCSAFVGMSYFGLNHEASFIRTGAIATSKYYKDITYPELRPGDILVRANSHTLMFLYWTNAERTQGMFIEQGGTEIYGTIICSIRSISSYKTYYKPRRSISFQ